MLEGHTRLIPLPGGKPRPVRLSRLAWAHYDFLSALSADSERSLLQTALHCMPETGLSFDAQLHEAICYYTSFHRANPAAGVLPALLPALSLKSLEKSPV
ncbi:hypothetical protein MishRS11D_46450 (plasmid) [Methylomagnum ishizawai]|nr:hypothetical protein MishRS11D_46450 [Methylomagnum ishizawai]